jgi:hypothetical protein
MLPGSDGRLVRHKWPGLARDLPAAGKHYPRNDTIRFPLPSENLVQGGAAGQKWAWQFQLKDIQIIMMASVDPRCRTGSGIIWIFIKGFTLEEFADIKHSRSNVRDSCR